MLLDINLSDGLSFSIFEKNDYNTPSIIFTTAYSEYAIKAFELNSVSYLLKPINRQDLKQAIDKYLYIKSKSSNQNHENKNYQDLMANFFKSYKERFLVKINNTLETIYIEDISYFYSEDKLTFIMLISGKTLPLDQSLKHIEQQIDPTQFYRINRKYLVSHNSIKKMYYTSKSRIKIELTPENKNDSDLNFVAIEKIGQFKKWLS